VARILALDWDNREFHLVEANVARGKVHVQRAVSWVEEEPMQPAGAEEFGKRLRERLKEAGIAAGPVVVGLGRDRLVIKEVRFPQVSQDVEAALVRNQIIKELTESQDDVYLDYFPLAEPGKSGERRALSLVVRKDIVQGIQAVARVAGLKLTAITARPFGTAACVKKLAGHVAEVPAPPVAEAVVAVLTVTQSWAEFSVMRGDQLLFARSLTVGDALLGEVRRNLAAYSGQPQLTFPRDAIQALYVAGNGENAVLREKLQATLGIAVHGLDPFAGEVRVQVAADTRAGFVSSVGLLQLWATKQAMPVNFVKPRESRPVASPRKRRALLYTAASILALLIISGVGYAVWSSKISHLEELNSQRALLAQQIKGMEPEIKYMEALREWRDGALPWLDELYDLTARSPYDKDAKGFRISQISITQLSKQGAAKDKDKEKDKEKNFTARMLIQCTVPPQKDELLFKLREKINRDPHCNAQIVSAKLSGIGKDQKLECTLQIDIARQMPSQYTTRMPQLKEPARPGKGPDVVE
jgi:Tfp pilus assembly PilM family ATPase